MIAKRQNKTAFWLLGLAFMMLVASFAAVPFYDWFCRVTGFAGTTQLASENESQIVDKSMKVRFSASTMRDMPWEFRPMTPHLDVKIGETNLVFFEAINPTDEIITGTASFNVAPLELGSYFSKIECFCFTEQTLSPGERVEMPVTFFVDPEILQDPDTAEIGELTLAYTFHLTKREKVN